MRKAAVHAVVMAAVLVALVAPLRATAQSPAPRTSNSRAAGAPPGVAAIREADLRHDMMGKPYEQMKYQPLGDLLLDFPTAGTISDYRRELDLDRAVSRVSYRAAGVTYTRDVFVSAPDQVLVMRLTADRPGAVTFAAELHGVRNPAHSNYGTDYFQMDGVAPDGLRLTGKSSDYLGIPGRIRYEARLVARASGGRVDVDYRTLRVTGADTVVLLFAAATNFVSYKDVSGDPAERVRTMLDRARSRTFDALERDHLAEYRAWFRRVSISLGGSPADVLALPTDERIKRVAERPDPALAALYYQFGRYLLISSSRPGTQAANLQGIWNENPNPWWDSKYTININLPMNYWPAESGNLAELVEPLDHLVRDLAEAGTETAREHWGARGWVVHQNTDLWRATAPMDGPSWGAWPVGGAWRSTRPSSPWSSIRSQSACARWQAAISPSAARRSLWRRRRNRP